MKNFLSAAAEFIREYWKQFTVSLVSLILICAIAAAGFLFIPGLFAESGYPDSIKYTLFGDSGSYAQNTLVRDGVLCVDFEELAINAGMSVSGDSTSLCISDTEGSAVFTHGSRTATVNSCPVTMERAAEISGRSLYLPLSFVRSCVSGLDISLSDDYSSLVIEKQEASAVTFALKGNSSLAAVSDVRKSDGKTGEYDFDYIFANDLDAYKKYMNPEDRDACLIYYSPDAPASSAFVPEDLTEVKYAKSGYSLQLSLNAERALEAMFIEMNTAGFTKMQVSAAYVSYKTQSWYYENYIYAERLYWQTKANGKYFSDNAYSVLGSAYLTSVYLNKGKYELSRADAETVVKTYCAVPGAADHMFGLSVDISDGSNTDFGKTEAYSWMCENAYKFGFIERFPDGDKKLTGFDWEPEHWRFVGQYHADIIHREGYCLEEYLSLIGLG